MPATSVLYHGAVVRVEDMADKFADQYQAFRGYAEAIAKLTEKSTNAETDKVLNTLPESLEGHFRWVFNGPDGVFEMKLHQPKHNSSDTCDYVFDRISCHDQGCIGPAGRLAMDRLLDTMTKAGDPDARITYHLGLSLESRWRYHQGILGPTFDPLAAWAVASRQRNPHFRPNLADEEYQPFLLRPAKPLEDYEPEELLQACRDAVASEGMPSSTAEEYLQLPGDQGYVLTSTRYGHVYGRIVHPTFHWHPASDPGRADLIIKQIVPDSVAESLIGKPVREVIDHPLLAHIDASITGYYAGGDDATLFSTDLAECEEVMLMPWSMKPTNS